jgi:hypothetical protein
MCMSKRIIPAWRARYARTNLVRRGANRVPSSFGSGARCEAADEILLGSSAAFRY